MGFFTNKLALKIQNSRPSFVQEWLSGGGGAPSASQIIVSNENALKYNAFWSCCRILAESFASVPIMEYKKNPNGDREQTDDTGMYDIFQTSPNAIMDSNSFKEASQYHINISGNFICRRVQKKTGLITGLQIIDWKNIYIDFDKTTSMPIYIINGNIDYPLKRSEIFHVPGPTFNGVVGMSPVSFLSECIRLGLTYEKYSTNFYQNGALPSGVFEAPGVMDDNSYKRLKEEIKENWQNLKNAGRPMLLEGGTKFTGHSIKPVDAQLLECRSFQVEETCRAMRVPPHMVYDLRRSTNNNIEHQGIEYVMYTMLPNCKRFESAINSQLLLPSFRKLGYYFECNLSGLLRGDQKSMAEAFAIGRQWGWLCVNDILRLLNLNKIPNGNIYLEPMNMVEAGKQSKIMGENIKKDTENMSKLIEIAAKGE